MLAAALDDETYENSLGPTISCQNPLFVDRCGQSPIDQGESMESKQICIPDISLHGTTTKQGNMKMQNRKLQLSHLLRIFL